MHHHIGSIEDIPEGYPPCALYGNGTLRFGRYNPTPSEKAWCQLGNDPWEKQFKYGYYTSYFAIVTTFIFILANLVKRDTALSFVCRKLLALGRYIAYPRAMLTFPRGPLLLWLSFVVFSAAYTFGVTPYIRLPNFGTYPIGVRAGWIAGAMLPWLYTLAVKRNILSVMTGVSYEKFQFLHQWGGWVCFALSIIHTITLVVRAQRQQPWSYTWNNNVFYTSGVGALVPIFVLCIFSLPFFRRRWYEAFFITHFIAAILFIFWMTKHVARSLGSQYYCYATIALWASAVIWRYGVIMWHILRSRGRLPVMRVDLHTNNGGLMTLTVPTHMRWEAGQHVFLRLPECDPATSHPFTIASLPNEARGTSDIENASGNNKNTMVFLVRAQQGFTARLQEKARKMAEAGQTPLFPVIIDGPYGIVPDHSEFNSVVLIAGGTGISFTLPILHGILREAANGVSICKRVELAWVVRNQAMFDIYMNDLQTAAKAVPTVSVSVSLYHSTAAQQDDALDDSASDLKENETEGVHKPVSILAGRPVLEKLVDDHMRATTGRVMFAACGPDSMLIDLRRGVTHAQLDILHERISVSEVVLHSEAFGW